MSGEITLTSRLPTTGAPYPSTSLPTAFLCHSWVTFLHFYGYLNPIWNKNVHFYSYPDHELDSLNIRFRAAAQGIQGFNVVAEWIHFTLFGIIFPTIKLKVYTLGGLMNSATKSIVGGQPPGGMRPEGEQFAKLWIQRRPRPREDLESRSPNLGPYTTKGTL